MSSQFIHSCIPFQFHTNQYLYFCHFSSLAKIQSALYYCVRGRGMWTMKAMLQTCLASGIHYHSINLHPLINVFSGSLFWQNLKGTFCSDIFACTCINTVAAFSANNCVCLAVYCETCKRTINDPLCIWVVCSYIVDAYIILSSLCWDVLN